VPIYRDIYDGPPKGYNRQKSAKRFIVVHNTANDAPARNEASYAKRRTDSVSSHYYADDEQVIQSLDTDFGAWHVGSRTGNTQGISYEITGTNGKSEAWWKTNVAWKALAACMARDCAHFGITPQLLSIEQIQSGRHTGIITHDQARRAWGGTDHTDPGKHFPLAYLADLVRGGKPAPTPPSKPTIPPTGSDLEDIVADLPDIGEGATGKWARRVQALCVAWGGDAAKEIERSGGIDGQWGSGTTRAVKIIQAAKGLGVDGRVGKRTWPVLIKG
jgi:N-acetyl-anhydromuramyl-L-alanine amidase AmpD